MIEQMKIYPIVLDEEDESNKLGSPPVQPVVGGTPAFWEPSPQPPPRRLGSPEFERFYAEQIRTAMQYLRP